MFSKVSSAVDSLKQISLDDFGIGKKPDTENKTDITYNSIEQIFLQDLPSMKNKIWKINATDWHKIMAYRFTVKAADKDEMMHFTLPIPPESYTVKPVIPNSVTPTFGGVYEQNSAIKLWQIHMSGTMGTGVGRSQSDLIDRKNAADAFRDVMSTTGMLSGAMTEIGKTISKVGGTIDRIVDGVGNVTDVINNGGNPLDAAGAAMGAVTGAINDVLLPPLPYAGSAVSDKSNGFSELEELQRFLFMYQALKAKSPEKFSLYYADYKTDKVWRIAINDFGIQKNANNPMLTRYTLSMTGWEVQSVNSFYTGEKLQGEFDRFGANGDLSPVNVLNPGQQKVLDKVSDISKAALGLGPGRAW